MNAPLKNLNIGDKFFETIYDYFHDSAYQRDDKLLCKKDLKIYDDCDHALIHENVDLIHKDISNWFLKIY